MFVFSCTYSCPRLNNCKGCFLFFNSFYHFKIFHNAKLFIKTIQFSESFFGKKLVLVSSSIKQTVFRSKFTVSVQKSRIFIKFISKKRSYSSFSFASISSVKSKSSKIGFALSVATTVIKFIVPPKNSSATGR